MVDARHCPTCGAMDIRDMAALIAGRPSTDVFEVRQYVRVGRSREIKVLSTNGSERVARMDFDAYRKEFPGETFELVCMRPASQSWAEWSMENGTTGTDRKEQEGGRER